MKISVNMGIVWDRATEFLSDTVSTILPLAALAIFLPMTVSAIIAPFAKVPATALWTNLASLLLSIASVWGQLAIVALAITPKAGRVAAVQVANKRIALMVGIMLLLFLGALLLIVPIPVVLGLSGVDMQAMASGAKLDLPRGAAGFVVLYSLALIPILLFLSARLALLTPVIVFERRGLGTIARSFVLTRGVVWKIVGVVILFVIVFGVAVLATQGVFGSIFRLLLGGDGAVTLARVLTAALVGAVETGFIVLAAVFTAKLYLAVRDAREAIVESA